MSEILLMAIFIQFFKAFTLVVDNIIAFEAYNDKKAMLYRKETA